MKRVFLDMDGVLCEYRMDASMEDMERDGYFRDLRPRPQMVEAVKALVQNGVCEVFVLSAVLPQKAEAAIREKNDWLDRYLPEIDPAHRLFPLCGTNEADAVDAFSDEDILCDDHSPNLARWIASGGRGVKILNEVNGASGRFRDGPRVRIITPEDLLNAVAAAQQTR